MVKVLTKVVINVRRPAGNLHFFCPILSELEFSCQVLVKLPNINFQENPSNGVRVISCGRSDMTKV
jgi:hypothetical protein